MHHSGFRLENPWSPGLGVAINIFTSEKSQSQQVRVVPCAGSSHRDATDHEARAPAVVMGNQCSFCEHGRAGKRTLAPACLAIHCRAVPDAAVTRKRAGLLRY